MSFHQFLAAYGHREALDLHASLPGWGDSPSTVFALLKGMIDSADIQPEQVGVANVERRLFLRAALRIGSVRHLVERQLGRGRDYTQFREDTHFNTAMARPVVRRILIEYGRRMAEVGALTDPEQIFGLPRQDLDLAWPPTSHGCAT